MKSTFLKLFAVFFLLLGIFAYIMDQTIEEGRLFESEGDYRLQAATLAYNPAIDQQQNLAAKQKLALLNTTQMYDLLARAQQVKKPSALANALVTINNQASIIPVDHIPPQYLTTKNATCRLLERKQRGLISEASSVYREYKQQFNGSLKLAVTDGQLDNIWQTVNCQATH